MTWIEYIPTWAWVIWGLLLYVAIALFAIRLLSLDSEMDDMEMAGAAFLWPLTLVFCICIYTPIASLIRFYEWLTDDSLQDS